MMANYVCHTIWLAVNVCYRRSGYRGPQPWQSQAQDVSGCWHDGACLPSAPPPGTSMCPCRGGRAWEGGEGRVQAERPTRTRPQGQGNGPEGERSMNSIARLVRAVGVLVDALSNGSARPSPC